MTELSPRARALLESSRSKFEPDRQDRARNEAALVVALGLTAVAVAAKSSFGAKVLSAVGKTLGISGATNAAVLTSTAVKIVIGASVVSSIAVGAATALIPRSEKPSSQPANVVATAASPASSLAAPPSAPALEVTSPSATTVETTVADSVRPPSPTRVLDAKQDHESGSTRAAPTMARPDAFPGARVPGDTATELSLIKRATSRLGAGDAQGALRAFEEHERTFPAGAFEEERTAGRVRALCALGRSSEAAALRERFLTLHGGSPYASSVRAACLSLPR